MALSLAELEFESGAVLPSRDTMFVVNWVTSRIDANSAFNVIINKAAGNDVEGAAGSTVSVSQYVSQSVG